MRLRTTAEGLIAQDPQRDRWVRLPERARPARVPRRAATPRAARAEAAIASDDAVEADPARGGAAVPAALDPRVHALGAARHRLEPRCW